MKVLAGDIGGTNTRIICADVDGKNRHLVAEKKYASSGYTSLIQVLEAFLLNIK